MAPNVQEIIEQDQSFRFELDLVATAGNTESLATLLCNNNTTSRLQGRGPFRKLNNKRYGVVST